LPSADEDVRATADQEVGAPPTSGRIGNAGGGGDYGFALLRERRAEMLAGFEFWQRRI
jgi:hypothetical protein